MTKRLLLALTLLLVVLTACQQQAAPTTGQAFVGGTEGLTVKFLSGLPPAEVFDVENPFQIALEIENKGEHVIANAQDVDVSITGISPSDFGVSASNLLANSPEPIRGASIDVATGNIIAGDIVTIDSFPELKYQKTVAGSVQFPVRANVCYEYGTRAQGKLCVRRELRTADASGLCNPTRDLPAENSGAPVQMINIRQTVSGADRIDFFFTIKQMGVSSDSVHKTGTSCDTVISNNGVVYVEVENTGLGELSCSGLRDGTATSGYVTLIDGQREIRCSQRISAPSDFEKIINVNLKYAYQEYVDTTLTVKQSR